MEKLNKKLIGNMSTVNNDLKVGNMSEMPEKVLQFGEGNFLRAFVDYMIDETNSNDMFGGSIVAVQPIEQGLIGMLNEQDGLYTVILRGLENGEKVVVKKVVTSISRGINPYQNFEDYKDCMKNPELRFIVSNTTESGITYNAPDKITDTPPTSFPAKITALLHERYKIFNGDLTKGFIFIPCELIDNNGSALKEIVIQYSKEWGLEEGFLNWIEKANYFTNTLVDRIVTGYPRDEVEMLTQELGYKDNLINTAEIFHFFVIEGPKELSEELPFHKIGLNVVWTDDATPYKARKVRILNGGHTMSVLAAYMSGKDTVGEMMEDENFVEFLKLGIFEEIIPTLDLEYEDLKSFADAVFDRFANPFIKHYLLSISLNSVSKYKTRVLPSILEYNKRKGKLPKVLTMSFAALIAFYKGGEIKDGALMGKRNGEEFKIMDDASTLEFFKDGWAKCDNSLEGITELVKNVCKKEDFWEMDLNDVEGFADSVITILHNITTNENGMYEEIKKLVGDYNA